MIVLIWIGLFAATAVTDYLSAKWVDSGSPIRRANISALHETIGLVSGFTVYAWRDDVWLVIPCVLGAWVGSFLAGVDRQEVDPQLLEAVTDAVQLVLDERRLDENKSENSRSCLPCR